MVTSWAADEGEDESQNDTGAVCVHVCVSLVGLLVSGCGHERDQKKTQNGYRRECGDLSDLNGNFISTH